MEKGKKHCTDGCGQRPPIFHKQTVQCGKFGDLCQAALRQIGHDDDGDHDFIRREAEKKAEQDRAVHAEALGERVKERGKMVQEGLVFHIAVCQQHHMQIIACIDARDIAETVLQINQCSIGEAFRFFQKRDCLLSCIFRIFF